MSYVLKDFTKDWAAHPLPQPATLVPVIEYHPSGEADIEPLSTQEKLTLLQMSRRVSHQAIWRAMREKFKTPPFTLSTFIQLRKLQLTELLPGKKYHSLTASGAQLCDLIGRQLVRDHRIHSPWIGGDDGGYTSLHCTCGWSCSISRGHQTQAKAAGAFGTHLRTVEAMDELKMALVPRKIEGV